MNVIFMGKPTDKQRQASAMRQRVHGMGQQPEVSFTVTVAGSEDAAPPVVEDHSEEADNG